jgi:uncharacterized protein YndB with AHSA1/START domain
MRYRTTIEIDRPPAEVFRVVAMEFATSYPKYCREAVRVDLDSPGPLALGTTGTITAKVREQVHAVRFNVTAFDPNRLLSFESRYEGSFSRYQDSSSRGSYVFDATPLGTTRLSIIDDVDWRGVTSLLARLTKPVVKFGARADARRLKRLLEAPEPPPSNREGQ